MVDYHEARMWADNHKAFGQWLKSVGREIGEAFRLLTELQYDQPWRREPVRRNNPRDR